MGRGPFYSFSDAADALGLDRQTVADLVRHWGIPWVNRGPCKCLDSAGFARLKAHLQADLEPALAS